MPRRPQEFAGFSSSGQQTAQFNMYKWEGGLNTSLNEGLISSDQLTRADNLIFPTNSPRKKREGIDHNFDNSVYHVTFAYTAVDASANTITSTAHSFSASAPVIMYTSGSMPGGLSEATIYYVKSPSADAFQLSSTPGGAAIDITSTGSGSTVISYVPAFQTTDVDASTDTITITAHGWKDHEPIQFTTSGTLPGGLSADTTYYVIEATTNTFRVTTSVASISNVVNITSTGSGVHRAHCRRRYIAGADYWYYSSGTKTQKYVAAANNGRLYSISTSGAVTDISGVNQSFVAASAATATDRITITSHGFTDTDHVYLYGNGTVPGGLTTNTYYYVHVVDANTITLRTSPTATADVDITSQGSGTNYLYAGWVPPSDATSMTACISVVNNFAVFTAGGGSYVPKRWNGTDSRVSSLHVISGSTFPGTFFPSLCQSYFGRLVLNSRTSKDKIYFSSTGNELDWLGAGDSGTVDVGVGDGDPEGITALFPSFKGDFFVAKRRKLYHISGSGPVDMSIKKLSDGIGCVSQATVASIDQDDIYFMSDRGIHSLVATAKYGDVEATYISSDIQTSIREDWVRSRYKYFSAAYIPNLNSYVLAVVDTENMDISSSSTSTLSYITALDLTTTNNALYLYNTNKKAWYRWPNVSCSSIWTVEDSDKSRLLLGTHVGRISKTFSGANYDTATRGAQKAVPMTIKTGIIYVDNNPNSVKAFKKFSLFYAPNGTHTINIGLKVDSLNYDSSTGENYLTYQDTAGADLLGSTFILGSSLLGSTSTLEPSTLTIGGYGKGIQLTITQTGLNEATEIQGFLIQYEGAGDRQELSSVAS